MKKLLVLFLVIALCMVPMVACTTTAPEESAPSQAAESSSQATQAEASESVVETQDGLRIGLVTKGAGIAFFEAVAQGATAASDELEGEIEVQGPAETTAEKQIEIINNFIAQDMDGILVSANDSEALAPSLKQAMEKGIVVVSYDGDVSVDARQLFVSTSDPAKVGKQLIDAANQIAEGEGEIAILSAAATAANQNTWIGFMEEELKKEENANLTLVSTVYGDDKVDKSYQEANGLLKSYPDLKVIIAPTAVGVIAAAKAVQDAGLQGEVFVTGLALPSEAAEYIKNGIMPKAYLWNPIDLGYISEYVIAAMVRGDITGKEGETVPVGTMGERQVTLDMNGNPEVIIGDMFEFNADNIAEWENVF